jgi:arylsulfatase A-like enzyme
MADSKPNIIMIITDQQRYDTIAALGFPFMETPHMDRLVREGVSFNNCFVTAPLCVPARASLFTGYYPHTTGVYGNGHRWTHSWVELLAAAGYHCVNIGKMHTKPLNTPLGFHERYPVENKDRFWGGERWFFDEWDKALAAQGLVKQQRVLYRQRPDYRERLGAFEWELPEQMHSDFFVGNMATWWLDTYPETQPLFLEIGFPGPHPPYDPVARYAESYLEKDLPILGLPEGDLEGQPPPFQELRKRKVEMDNDSIAHSLNPTPEQMKRQRAYYLANVTMIDEKLGQILDGLDRNGYLDNSVVIFTSDHGDCLCDHGHSQKGVMYDAATQVPAIIWSPGRFEGGRRVDGLCSWMDLGPTVLEIAGLEAPGTMEAMSLLRSLNGEGQKLRDYVFSEFPSQGGMMTMVRSHEWKLVDFSNQDYGQLFNMQKDPDEVVNLWEHPEAQDVKSDLRDAMRTWLIQSNLETGQWQADWR